MKKLAFALLLALPGTALASCPAMGAYTVTGVTAEKLTLPDALSLLFEGTAWKPEVTGEAADVRVTFRGVSGPLDQVFTKVIEQAGKASPSPMAALRDPARCVAAVSVRKPQSASSAVSVTELPPIERPAPRDVLSAGTNLSAALEEYVNRRGWQLRWLIEEDYMLDVDLPLKGGDFIEAVTNVVRTYQAQGGMEGVVPRFARGNNVVVIEKMDVREAE